MPATALSPILHALFAVTLALIAWVAVRGPEPPAGVVLRLSLAALLAAVSLDLVRTSATVEVLALPLQLAALTIAYRAAGLPTLRRRRVAARAPLVPFEDFRRAA